MRLIYQCHQSIYAIFIIVIRKEKFTIMEENILNTSSDLNNEGGGDRSQPMQQVIIR